MNDVGKESQQSMKSLAYACSKRFLNVPIAQTTRMSGLEMPHKCSVLRFVINSDEVPSAGPPLQ